MRNPGPKVSVILNCYNHEPFVAEAIESVLAQTMTDFELLLVDNGSTDGTRAVLNRYDDPRIRRMFHDTNESLSRRLNQGVAAARGAFVCVLYSDDMMLPDKLERQLELFAALPGDYGVVYAPARSLNQLTGARWLNQCAEIDGAFMPAILHRSDQGYPDMSSPLIRRACFEHCRWHEDLFSDGETIYLRIGLRWKFHYDPAPTVVLRDHGGNMGKAILKNHDMLMTICDRLAEDPAFPADMAPDLARYRAEMCRSSAWIALRVGTRDTAWVWRQLRAVLHWRAAKALHPRWIAAVLLALVPWRLREWLNVLGRRIAGGDKNAALVTDYAPEVRNP